MIRRLAFFVLRHGRELLLGVWLVSGASGALATLGQAPCASSVSCVAAAGRGLYSVHERQLENGTSVKEYANPTGIVFAVSWRGPVLPNLSDLLGDYFNAFKREVDLARTLGKRGSPIRIETSDVVVQSHGRMRNFFGHAYAPALIPVGVTVQDVLP